MLPNEGGVHMVAETDEVSWHAARARAQVAVSPLPADTVPLDRAEGRVLAAALVAARPLPGFDSAAMDGYAVRGHSPWLVRGRTLAGETTAPPLAEGHAREIATGAVVPPGTEAVLPYENGRRCGELLNGYVTRQNIRRAGEEARIGDELVPAGTRITPQVQALAAALGYDELVVGRQPRVVALITGNEVLAYGVPEPGQLRDAIGPALPGLVAAVGGRLVGASYLPDQREALFAAVVDADADIVLVSGSSSVGRADHLRAGLQRWGAEPVVDGVACRPGHSQSLWRAADGRVVVGLPGNPFAAFVALFTLVQPCCAGLLGTEVAPLRQVPRGPLRQHPQRTRLTPVRVLGDRVERTEHDGSAMLRGLALADALAVVPPATVAAPRVELLPLPGR